MVITEKAMNENEGRTRSGLKDSGTNSSSCDVASDGRDEHEAKDSEGKGC